MNFLMKMQWLLKLDPHRKCTLMVPHIWVRVGVGVVFVNT